MKTRNQRKMGTGTLDLVFDVETTGLPPSNMSNLDENANKRCREYEDLARPFRDGEKYSVTYKNVAADLDRLPHITQISWALIDAKNHDIIESYNEYIRLPVGVTVPAIVTSITGITESMCNTIGVDIVDAMTAFARAFFRCSTVVAHNIEFDRLMICAEVERNRARLTAAVPYIRCMFHPRYDATLGVHQFDTMFRTMNICQIYRDSKNGAKVLKPPKLVELYKILFHETPDNLHNSMVDVLVCARCFLKVRYHWDVPDAQFLGWMNFTMAATPKQNKNYSDFNDDSQSRSGTLLVDREYVPAACAAATAEYPAPEIHAGEPLPSIHTVSAGYAT